MKGIDLGSSVELVLELVHLGRETMERIRANKEVPADTPLTALDVRAARDELRATADLVDEGRRRALADG